MSRELSRLALRTPRAHAGKPRIPRSAFTRVARLCSLGFPSPQIEIRTLLERLYQLPVSKVATANVEGKKKRSRGGMYRRPDFKLAYVKLSEAVKIPAPPKPPPKAEGEAAKAKAKA